MLETKRAGEFSSTGLAEVGQVAQAILNKAEGKICLFIGDMGSGKTTLIREICEIMGTEDNVASPTFSLVNEYQTGAGLVYHFDFYRVDSLEEALDAGVEDYFYSGNLCLIEWPEIIEPVLPDRYLKIEIDNIDKEKRNYKLTTYDSSQAHRV